MTFEFYLTHILYLKGYIEIKQYTSKTWRQNTVSPVWKYEYVSDHYPILNRIWYTDIARNRNLNQFITSFAYCILRWEALRRMQCCSQLWELTSCSGKGLSFLYLARRDPDATSWLMLFIVADVGWCLFIVRNHD